MVEALQCIALTQCFHIFSALSIAKDISFNSIPDISRNISFDSIPDIGRNFLFDSIPDISGDISLDSIPDMSKNYMEDEVDIVERKSLININRNEKSQRYRKSNIILNDLRILNSSDVDFILTALIEENTISENMNLVWNIVNDQLKSILGENQLCQKEFRTSEDLATYIEYIDGVLENSGPTEATEDFQIVYENLQHKCKLCDKEFCDIESLKKHNIQYRNIHNVIECNLCGMIYPSKDNLKTHNCSIGRFVCNFTSDGKICGKSFKTQSHIKKHIESIHEEKKFRCDICEKDFSLSKNLKIHKKVIHDEGIRPYQCTISTNNGNICKEYFRNISQLKDHIERIHEKKDISQNDFTASCSLKKQYDIKGENEDYQKHEWCPEIQNIRGNASNLSFSSESSSIIQEEITPYQCTISSDNGNICGKSFKYISQLINHIESIHEDKKYRCDICQKDFITSYSLMEHKNNVHETGIRQHECKICKKSFILKDDFKNHIDLSHNCKKLYCDICQKFFSSSNSLNEHKSTIHERIKRYKCKMCEKCYNRKSYLKAHIKSVHERVKDHKCDTCGRDFGYSNDLKRHVASVHEGKKYCCDICQKYFSSSGGLRRHKSSAHEGMKRYKCEICEKCYSRKNNLAAHIKKRHEKKVHGGLRPYAVEE